MCGLEIKATDSIRRKQQFVVYQALYGDFQLWIRPVTEFMSAIDKDKYPTTDQEYRFEKVK